MPGRTTISLLTPPGRGALATIVVNGPAAWQFTNACLVTPIVESQAAMRKPWLREFRGSGGGHEELVVVFPGPDEARIHCHGGIAACEAVLQALESQGAARVVSNNALATALTERTALILLDQLHGAFTAEIAAIGELLTQAQTTTAVPRLEQLLQRAPLGLHLNKPWQAVIAGRPNAGKSSLLNALLGFQRSITSEQPGTTRDVVTARTALDGWPIELRDTAGLRTSQDTIEAAGVELAENEIRTADLLLYLLPADETAEATAKQLNELQQIRSPELPTLIVITKADLAVTTSFAADLHVSVWQNQGIEALCQKIVERLIGTPPEPGAAVPFERAQIVLLQEALQRTIANDSAAARKILKQLADAASASLTLHQ